MQATTIAEILPIIAGHLGLDECEDREEIFREIYALRKLMFSGLGKEVKEAFFTRPHCEVIRHFHHDCRGQCNRDYYGISLPADMTKAEVMRVDGERIEISPEFSEPIFGRNLCCIGSRRSRNGHYNDAVGCNPCCILGVDLGKGWPLPIDPKGPVNLGFKYRSLAGPDCEEELPLTVGVSYTDMNNQIRRENIAVDETISLTTQTVKVIHQRGITLPPNRKGIIEVYDDDNLLAEYNPNVSVPDHRRIAIGLRQEGRMVELEDALFEPQKACFDTDFVETDDPVFWQNLIMWKDLHFKTKKTPVEQGSYNAAFQVLVSQASQVLDAYESDSFLPIIEPHIPQVGMRRNYKYLRR